MDVKKHVSSGLFILILICFALPFFSFSCGGMNISVSGYQMVVGKTMSSPGSMFGLEPKGNQESTERLGQHWSAILLLLLSVTGLVFSLINNIKYAFHIAIISFGSVFFMIIMLIWAYGYSNEAYGIIDISTEIGFKLTFLLFISSGIYNYLMYRKKPDTFNTGTVTSNDFTGSAINTSNESSYDKVCPNCNTNNKTEAVFCKMCGNRFT